jgi:pseudo-rSAM protein
LNKEKTYFTVEPYVYISIKKQGVFLYNTLNQKIIQSDYPPVVNLVKRLNRGNRLQVIQLNWGQAKKDPPLFRFLEKARAYLMGDLIHRPADALKPVQLVPMTGLLKDEADTKPGFSFAKEGMTYLGELTFFINASCDLGCGMCRDAYKQFPCCRQTRSNPRELDIDSIKKILKETDTGFLTRIHISGGDILKYKKYTELLDLLKKNKAAKSLYIHYLNLARQIAGFNVPDPSFVLNVLVSFPVDPEKFKNLLHRLENKNLNYKAVFIAQSEHELMQAQDILSRFSIDRFSFSPYYNGRNLGFFKKYVYIRKNNLLNAKPSIKDIHARKAVNHNCFGHLVILNNGRVYANLNARPLGNIHDHSIRQLVYKELRKKNQWLKTRDTVKPCRDCHYRLLCPSISNYEYAVGKNNLCTIYKENKHEIQRP